MDPCHIYAAYNALKSDKKLKSDPTIHLLYQELSDLYHTVSLSFLTLEYIGNKQGSKLLLIDPKLAEKQLNDKQMRIGEETRKSLALLSKDEKETFYSRCRFISDLLSLNEVNRLTDEWLMYSIETTDDSWIIKRNGHPKYLTLYKLIKNILIISYGNADVERGFSINQNILTEDCTLLSEKSINGLRTTYDVVKFLGFESIHK
ncbi:unnamed protein product, partial [Adineta steineri]